MADCNNSARELVAHDEASRGRLYATVNVQLPALWLPRVSRLSGQEGGFYDPHKAVM
jgi:hypothetical protein